MKILFVRTYCPNSILYGSEMRAALYIDYFLKKGKVDLLTLTASSQHADTSYIKSKFNRHYYFDQRENPQRMGGLEKFFNLVPWQLTGHYARDFQKKLTVILEENQYDLIFVFKLEPIFYFLQLAPRWRKRVVVDFDDILSDLYLNHYQNFLTASKNHYSLKFYEYKALKQFRRIFVCSRDAVSRIPPKYRNKIGIIPNVFPVDTSQFTSSVASGHRLLFVGSLDYFPNMEGLKWFCTRIWPEVIKEYPEIALSIIGKIQKDALDIHSLLGNPPNTQVAINVPSVSPYYKNCTATVVPLLNASGTRLKILESAAYGRPVITTAKGMEGLDFEHGKSIFIFKDAGSLINAYKALLNKEKYAQVTNNAFAVLKQRYSPDVFLSSMNEHWPLMIE